MDTIKKIAALLPGYNCGSCGYDTCMGFGEALFQKQISTDGCPLLQQERYRENHENLKSVLSQGRTSKVKDDSRIGVLDGYEADIVLFPLDGEYSCREVLLPMTNLSVMVDDLIEYRPIGCPIVHYARVIKKEHLLITVYMVGPQQRLGKEAANCVRLGNCMVIGFEGRYKGRHIRVGETIRFLPHHCMMQKVHSGVVVGIENDNVSIEGIDLKVWHPPTVTAP